MATNIQRRTRTRTSLINAASELFANQGYAATSTSAILAGAGVTRGAMYHHFSNKAALFEAVCEVLCQDAMTVIEAAVAGQPDSLASLKTGSLAWLDYMMRDDVRQIMLIDGPAVLGLERWRALDERHSYTLLREGISDAVQDGALRFAGSAAGLAMMLNGAMNALVLNAPSGQQYARLRQDLLALFDSLANQGS